MKNRLLYILLIFCFKTICIGQNKIKFEVKDDSGFPLENVKCEVYYYSLKKDISNYTNQKGNTSLINQFQTDETNISPTVKIILSKEGFDTYKSLPFSWDDNKNFVIELKTNIETFSTKEDINNTKKEIDNQLKDANELKQKRQKENPKKENQNADILDQIIGELSLAKDEIDDLDSAYRKSIVSTKDAEQKLSKVNDKLSAVRKTIQFEREMKEEYKKEADWVREQLKVELDFCECLSWKGNSIEIRFGVNNLMSDTKIGLRIERRQGDKSISRIELQGENENEFLDVKMASNPIESLVLQTKTKDRTFFRNNNDYEIVFYNYSIFEKAKDPDRHFSIWELRDKHKIYIGRKPFLKLGKECTD
jgi:hypothetical protein